MTAGKLSPYKQFPILFLPRHLDTLDQLVTDFHQFTISHPEHEERMRSVASGIWSTLWSSNHDGHSSSGTTRRKEPIPACWTSTDDPGGKTQTSQRPDMLDSDYFKAWTKSKAARSYAALPIEEMVEMLQAYKEYDDQADSEPDVDAEANGTAKAEAKVGVCKGMAGSWVKRGLDDLETSTKHRVEKLWEKLDRGLPDWSEQVESSRWGWYADDGFAPGSESDSGSDSDTGARIHGEVEFVALGGTDSDSEYVDPVFGCFDIQTV
jgi:hypothetical protein